MLLNHATSETVFQIVTSLLAIITNYILFILIKNESPKSLGGYKYLMMYIALFEIFYAAFDMIFLPYMHSTTSGFLVILDPAFFTWDNGTLQVLDYIFCGSFGMLMSLFAIHFVFRFLVVSGNKTWTSTSSSTISIWLSVPLIVGLLWSLVCVLFLGKNDVSDQVMKRELNADLAYVGPYIDYYPNASHNLNVYIGLALMVLIGVLCFLCTTYFGLRCYFEVRALTKDSSKSYSYKSLQAQLFYVLVAQSTIPFLFVFLPAAVLAITIYINLSHPNFGKVLTLSNAIYPVFDPLPNMLMIKSYRDSLICWRKKKRRANLVMASANNSFFSESCTWTADGNQFSFQCPKFRDNIQMMDFTDK